LKNKKRGEGRRAWKCQVKNIPQNFAPLIPKYSLHSPYLVPKSLPMGVQQTLEVIAINFGLERR
jgi:hypothetical protein